MITITQNAANQIKALMDKAPEGAQGVRLSVKATGCSGNSYKMDYIKSNDDTSGDDIINDKDVQLNIPKIYSWMLIGTTVDYTVDELGSSKFSFSNPNESGRCGCGESFNVDVDKLKEMAEQESN